MTDETQEDQAQTDETQEDLTEDAPDSADD